MPPTRRRPPAARTGRPPARRRPGPLRRITGGLALLVLTAAGLGHEVVNGVSDAINRVDAFGGMQGRPAGSQGTNYLLVGTDGRDGVDPADKQRYHLGGVPCHCTDTIMLVHLSEDRARASVISIPRDTYVRLPGLRRGAAAPGASPTPASATHPAKINEAYADGGPKLTVRTVERLTGVHIDHYLEIDFVSFMKTVDVIGGVPVCTRTPLRDPYSGLDLPAGTTTLNGGQALQYVRSRHLDRAADLGRMQRQQRFVAQVIRRITGGGTLADPVRLGRVVGTVLGSVRADQGLTATDLIALAQGMKGFSPSSSEFVQVPLSTVGYSVPGVGSTVKWDERGAGRLWATIRADRPLTVRRAPAAGPAGATGAAGSAGATAGTAVARGSGGPATPRGPAGSGGRPGPGDPAGSAAAAGPFAPAARTVEVAPSQIRVRLENGTDTNGLAAAAQWELAAAGFLTPGLPTTSDHRSDRTVIRYDPRWDRSVRSLAAAIPGALLVPVRGQGPVMDVVLGPDFTKVVPVATAPAPPKGVAVAAHVVTGDEETCG